MKFSVFAALVLTSSAPSVVQSWSCSGGRRSSFSSAPNKNDGFPSRRGPPGQWSPYMARRRRALADRMLEKTDRILHEGNKFSPPQQYNYNLVDDETKFELSVDVPGVKMEDIDIRLEDGFLTVRGQRIASSCKAASKFSQTFPLDPAVEVDKLAATLELGVLTVAAPKDMQKLEENIRKIPITSTAATTEDVDVASPDDSPEMSSSSSVPDDATVVGEMIADSKTDEDESASSATTTSGLEGVIGLGNPAKIEDDGDSALGEEATPPVTAKADPSLDPKPIMKNDDIVEDTPPNETKMDEGSKPDESMKAKNEEENE
mmetsp:Transcript_28170/g.43401  ORF Transcript_28170/g.43401 Transcript_28170/m.43401 type:complete len:318 (+) Transcript_28170:63-1016(+)